MELAEGSRAVVGQSATVLRDVLTLAKPRLSLLVLSTTAVGMAAAPTQLSSPRAVSVLIIVALLVASANALNNVYERHSDGRMRRTAQRPLPAKRLSWRAAQTGALSLGAFSLGALYLTANPMTALLGFVAWSSYAWLYTPMKARSAWAVVVGTVPGALPPLMGWTAACGRASAGGWSLFFLLATWQLPHFMAIAVRLSDDYGRAGLPVLPSLHGFRRAQQVTVASAAVFVASLQLPAWAHLGGRGWRLGAPLLGLGFVATCLWRQHEVMAWARRVFVASIGVLAGLLVLVVAGGALGP